MTIILSYWQTLFFCRFRWFRWVLDTLLKVLVLIGISKNMCRFHTEKQVKELEVF